MKNWKKFASLLLALVMCLSMAACGDNGSNGGEVSNDGEITLDDLVGYWSPVEGLGSTTSALICSCNQKTKKIYRLPKKIPGCNPEIFSVAIMPDL